MSDETTELSEPAEARQATPEDAKPSGQEKVKPAKPDKSKQAKAKKAPKAGKATGKKAGGKKGRAQDASSAGPSVAAHPRAGGQVRRARGWGGLVGFAIAAYLSMHAGVPTYDVGIRALTAGAAGYLLAWACSVTVWRHLMVAELRLAAERRAPENPDRPRGGDG